MDISQRRATLAGMYYKRKVIDATLERVIVKLYEAWDTLSEADRRAIEEKQKRLAESIRQATSAFDRGTKIDAFLRELEGIDGVLEVAFDELLEGKTSEVMRNAGGPQQSVADRLVQLLEDDPRSYAPRAIAKGLDFGDLEAFVDDAPTSRGLVDDSSPTEVTVPLFTKVDFPAKIESTSEAEHPLVVQLVLNRPQESRIDTSFVLHFPEPQTPKLVEVKVSAPGFEERTGVWTRTMAVYRRVRQNNS